MPRTRTANKDANYKVYYSKKVPQQTHFPHKRKTVRRHSTPADHDADKRQMRFLPEKMRIVDDGCDGSHEDEDSEEEEEGGVALDMGHEEEVEKPSEGKSAGSRGKKRSSDVMKIESDEDEELNRPTSKRQRKTATPKEKKHSRRSKATSAQDESRRSRRQSTMTQIVHGRLPLSDTEEPEYKPIKRSPRVSWSARSKSKDKQQRTLTQMVHGLRPTEVISADDVEESLSDAAMEEEDGQAYEDVIAQRLARDGLLQSQPAEEADTAVQPIQSVQAPQDGPREESIKLEDTSAPVLDYHTGAFDGSDDGEDSYEPTQFIEAPVTRTRRVPRRASGKQVSSPLPAVSSPAIQPRSRTPRFGLLSTPEKRRVREIASSQSPGESPLSTQVSPQRSRRVPLSERSGNTLNPADTPSKRKKVTFEEPAKEQRPPPSLRKFKSVIQDSEDEGDDLDDDVMDDRPVAGQQIGTHTQAMIDGIDNPRPGTTVGAETQAVLDQIDHACAEADDDIIPHKHKREPSEELDLSRIPQACENSPIEPDEQPPQVIKQEMDIVEEQTGEHTAQVFVKQEPSQELEKDMAAEKTLLLDDEAHSDAEDVQASVEDELPLSAEQVRSSPPIMQPHIEDTCPSTPLVLMDDSSDEENEPDPTPPQTARKPLAHPPSLKQATTATASSNPPPNSPPETQSSHSSKAELQLQSEWLSYSQYISARPAQSSSMHVSHDKSSYSSTPHAPGPAQITQITQQHSGLPHSSQATTIDEVTPRKNKSQRLFWTQTQTQSRSSNTTPRHHRLRPGTENQSLTSPSPSPKKPPPLFIPSSFPSPEKARQGWSAGAGAGMSSPVFARTQDVGYGNGNGDGDGFYDKWSVEDFSIPPPPPPIFAEDDEDE